MAIEGARAYNGGSPEGVLVEGAPCGSGGLIIADGIFISIETHICFWQWSTHCDLLKAGPKISRKSYSTLHTIM